MTILEPGSREHGELDARSKANMERCANFLVRMIEKYGKEVLDEIEAEERAKDEQKNSEKEVSAKY